MSKMAHHSDGNALSRFLHLKQSISIRDPITMMFQKNVYYCDGKDSGMKLRTPPHHDHQSLDIFFLPFFMIRFSLQNKRVQTKIRPQVLSSLDSL